MPVLATEREFEHVGRIQEIAEQQGTAMATLYVSSGLANPASTRSAWSQP